MIRLTGNFQPLSYCVYETAKYESEVTLLLITNRKLHMHFHLLQKSVTLDDLEWPLHTLLHYTCVLESDMQIFNNTVSDKNVARRC